MSMLSLTSSIKERLAALMPCDDSSCCCIPERSTVIFITIINFFGCVVDMVASFECASRARRLVHSMRKLLVTMFQAANFLLLVATIFEIAFLVDIYVWYTLGYIVMGFAVAIYEFVLTAKRRGARSLVTFVPEVVFLFVIFRCLPLVDLYRRHLYSETLTVESAQANKT